MPSLTLEEARGRAAALTVASYDVQLDLREEGAAGSLTRVRFSSTVAETFADLRGADGVTVRLDGVELPDAYEDGRVRLSGLGPGEHLLEVDARIPYVTDGSGLIGYTDPLDGQRYVVAACGMDLASSVFCCFDQPDLKAPIRLRVDADPTWTVLGNGELLRRYGGHTEFARTPPIPTYGFAVCAGPWASLLWESPGGLPMGWHARSSQRAALERDADRLRDLAEGTLRHYDRVFTPPYAFGAHHQVFCPGLNWGALEQPGCILVNEAYLTPDPPTPLERTTLAMLTAHEAAHLWFGDLATMRWWEDSWLNESFADFMGYQVAAELGYDDAWLTWSLGRKRRGYDADARRSTHSVAADPEDVVDMDTAFSNFDMITYAKGAAAVQQLGTWLGERQFLAGVNTYLTAHAFANADLGDFLDALSAGTAKDVRGWAEAWLRTTGFDTIEVTRDGDVPVLTRIGSRPHRFHVAAFEDEGRLVGERLVRLDDKPLRLPDWAGMSVLPNSRDETFARLALDPASWAVLAEHLGGIGSARTRALLWGTAFDQVIQRRLPVSGLLQLAERHLVDESSPVIVDEVLAQLTGRVRSEWAGELASYDPRLAAVCRRLLESTTDRPGVLRALAAVAGPEIAELLGTEIDQRTRWAVVRRLAELGDDRTAAESERDPSATGYRAALTARAAHPDGKDRAWALMVAPEVSNDDYVALAAGFWTPGQDLEEEALRYLSQTPAQARGRGQGFSGVLGKSFPRCVVTPRFRDAASAAVDEAPTVLRRGWSDRIDDLDLALSIRTAATDR